MVLEWQTWVWILTFIRKINWYFNLMKKSNYYSIYRHFMFKNLSYIYIYIKYTWYLFLIIDIQPPPLHFLPKKKKKNYLLSRLGIAIKTWPPQYKSKSLLLSSSLIAVVVVVVFASLPALLLSPSSSSQILIVRLKWRASLQHRASQQSHLIVTSTCYHNP